MKKMVNFNSEFLKFDTEITCSLTRLSLKKDLLSSQQVLTCRFPYNNVSETDSRNIRDPTVSPS